MRSLQLFSFDPKAFDLRAEATRLLAEAGPLMGFGCFVGPRRLEDFRAEERVFSSFRYEKWWRRCVLGSERFLKAYDDFVEQVICPHLQRQLPEAATFYCQRPPTLRLQPGPSQKPRHVHNDAKYGHQPGEARSKRPRNGAFERSFGRKR